MPKFVESRVRVRYAETDQMAIAHHANYLVWFEIGRTDLCRAAGITYREIEERGMLLVVVEIGCRYVIPFRYDDEVLIRTSIAEAGSRSMRFAYELRDTGGETLHATGFSRHFWLSRELRRPVKADAVAMQAFEEWVPRETRPS
jgi:acyl-CoA thioester hydrolase